MMRLTLTFALIASPLFAQQGPVVISPAYFGADAWREPVADFASLPACAAGDAGDARVTLDTSTVYVCTGSAWQAAGVDTTCLDAGVNCLFAASSSEGGAATTATALAANGTNCSAGQAAQGVDASGNAEGCFAAEATGTANVVAAFDSDGSGLVDSPITRSGNDLRIANPYRMCFAAGAGTLPICIYGWIDGYAQICRAGSCYYTINSSAIYSTAGTGGFLMSSGASATSPGVGPYWNDGDVGMGRAGSNHGTLTGGGATLFGFKLDGSTAVTYTPAATTAPTCDAIGLEYNDDSGAKCWCDGSSWQKVIGTGTCA